MLLLKILLFHYFRQTKIAEIQRVMFDTGLLNTNITELRTILEIFPKVIQSAVEEILLFFPTIHKRYHLWGLALPVFPSLLPEGGIDEGV